MHGWKAGIPVAISIFGAAVLGTALLAGGAYLFRQDERAIHALPDPSTPSLYTGSNGITVHLSRDQHLTIYTDDGVRYEFSMDDRDRLTVGSVTTVTTP